MSDKRKVSTALVVLCIFIPILLIYMTARMHKKKQGTLVFLAILGSNIGLEMLLPYPWGLLTSLVVHFSLAGHYANKWSREWNKSLENPAI